MKQTNLLSCRLSAFRTSVVKSLGLMSISLLFFIVLGTQNVTAQTMVDIGELKSEHTIKLVQGEIEFLEVETKNSSANSIHNGQLIAYYNDVIARFKNGEDFKAALKDTRALSTNPTKSTGAPTFSTSAGEVIIDDAGEYKTLHQMIDDVNLADGFDGDLIAIFNYLRTLKNQ